MAAIRSPTAPPNSPEDPRSSWPVTARMVQPPSARRSSRNGAGDPGRAQPEVHHGDGAGRVRLDAGPVGDPPDQPQPVARLDVPDRRLRGLLAGAIRAVVDDLAAHPLGGGPHPQPALPGTVPHRVGGQFVHGQDEVPGAAVGQPGLRAVRRHRRPQRVERITVEGLIQGRGLAVPGRRAPRLVPGRYRSSAHQADARHVAGAEQHERRLDAGVAVQRHRPGRGQAAGRVHDHPGARAVDERHSLAVLDLGSSFPVQILLCFDAHSYRSPRHKSSGKIITKVAGVKLQ